MKLGESGVDTSLDAARLLSIAVTVTSEQRVESVLQRTVQGLAAQPGVALARIWLLPSIHLPGSWQQPSDALEGMEHLHLVASAGTPIDSPGEDWSFLQGHFARFPMYVGKVGQVAAERHPILIKDVVYDDSWVVRPEWVKREKIRSFAGYPLVFRDNLLGVIAVFSRKPLGDQEFTWLGLFANYAAVAIANTRAFEDLKSLNRTRAELAHMARVTTLSALTASIAHEINQPIAAVTTSAGACLRWLDRDQPEVQRALEAARRIEEDGKRAAEIITHLKSFYKKDVVPQRERVSVNDLVGEMLVLLRSEADRHAVAMRTELAADLPGVNGHRVQLQQVLMNLMLNGMEAMSEGGGDLTIGTCLQGGEVLVSVSDTGVGLPADQMDDIFNAFVTTKPGGTGMGLAISRTIIESHGGRLWAPVNPGRGATFHFTLPTGPEAPL
jgi:signal transduction histidine kinase